MFALAPGLLDAQEFRATIIGQVNDSTGAALPRATITAVKEDTGVATTATSDAAGVFSVQYLLPGSYTVTVEAKGFQKALYRDIVLSSDQKLNLNVKLSPGSVLQQMTVTASPGLLDTATASTGGVMDEAKVQLTATAFQNPFDEFLFVQGVRDSGVGGLEQNSTLRGADPSYSANGSPGGDNQYYINGTPVSHQGTALLKPSQDAVQELQVEATAYDTQYGWLAGGGFGATLKTGTNHIHGDLYEYYENDALNANTIQGDVGGVPKSLNISNRFGGTVGGPIRKDKTFFFASYDGWRQDQPIASLESVPTAAMRQGNFAGTGYTIYDPSTVTCVKTSSAGCSTYGRTAFANDTIPSAEINPIGQAILNLYPQPTTTGITSNYDTAGPRNLGYDQWIGRIDHNLSQNTRIYGLLAKETDWSNSAGNGFPGPGSSAGENPTAELDSVFDVSRTISTSFTADFRASFLRQTDYTTTGTAISQDFTGSKIGNLMMPVVPTTTHLNLVPTISLSNYNGIFGNTSNGSVVNQWYLSPSFGEVKGRHTLNYGFQFQDVQEGAVGIPGQPNGTFGFSGQWTRQNPLANPTPVVGSVADLLLGYPDSGSVSWDQNNFINYHYYGIFIQDDYKVLRNVTLNLGLRWDAFTSPTERYNRINNSFCLTCANPYTSQINYSTFPNLPNPLTGGWTFAGVNGEPRAPYHVALNEWQPRIGIAWALRPNWVVRAGFGIFYNYGMNGTTTNGFSQTTSYVDSLNGSVNPTPYFLQGQPFPSGVLAPTGASQGLATLAGNGASYDTPGRVVPWTQHWTFDVQRAIPGHILVDVGYAGSHTRPLTVGQAQDIISTAQQQACFLNNAICNTNVTNPFYGILPAATTLGSSKTLQAYQLMLGWPLFNGVTQNDDPIGYSNYNALQVRAERRVRTVDFIVNYTYAGWMYANSYLNNGDYRDANLWYGPASADLKHYVNATAVWPLPFGRGSHVFPQAHGILGGIINGWQFDPSFIIYTGSPLGTPSANLVGGPGCTSYEPVGGQSPAHMLNDNTACYKDLAPWQPRTTPLYLGYLRNPPYFQMDAALQKQFTLPERIALQARIESVNATNTPSWYAGVNLNNDQPRTPSGTGWTGFGTIAPSDTPRYVFVSLKFTF